MLLERAVKAGEAGAWQLAYLSDRVAGAGKRPRPYGTQLDVIGPCEIEFFQLDDAVAVDARRKAIGMPTLAEYRQAVIDNALPASCRKP